MATVDLVVSEFIVLAIVIFFLLRYYRSHMVTADVTISVYLSWVLGFVGILLLPYDISVSLVDSSQSEILNDVWKFVYWSTFLLAWIVLPIQNEFHNSGHFSFCGKLMDALKKLFLAGVLCAAAAIIYIVVMVATHKGSPSEVVGFMMAMGNTYGVFIIIILMGSGLVALPRRLWQLSNYYAELQRLYITAPGVEAKYQEARYELEDCEHDVTIAVACQQQQSRDKELESFVQILQLKVSNFTFASRSTSRKHVKRLQQPHKGNNSGGGLFGFMSSSSGASAGSSADGGSGAGAPGLNHHLSSSGMSLDSKSGLVDLHARLIQAQIRVRACDRRWRVLLKQCKRVEELVHGRGAPENTDAKWSDMKTSVSTDSKSSWNCNCCTSWSAFCDACDNLWMTVFFKHVCRIGAVVCAILSAFILWSEMVMSTKLHSPIGELMGAYNPGSSIGDAQVILVQAVSFLALMYMSVCMYWSLFRLNLGWAFTLQGPQQSPPSSLIFNGEYFSRLQFPLGYNFLMTLNVPRMSSTSFSNLMQNIELVPVFGTSFQVYVPLFMIIVALMTFFNVFSRLLNLVGVESDDAVGALPCSCWGSWNLDSEDTAALVSGHNSSSDSVTSSGSKKKPADPIRRQGSSWKLTELEQEKYDMGRKLVCSELKQQAANRVGNSVINAPLQLLKQQKQNRESTEFDGDIEIDTISSSNDDADVENGRNKTKTEVVSRGYRGIINNHNNSKLEFADEEVKTGYSIGKKPVIVTKETDAYSLTLSRANDEEEAELEMDDDDVELEFNFNKYIVNESNSGGSSTSKPHQPAATTQNISNSKSSLSPTARGLWGGISTSFGFGDSNSNTIAASTSTTGIKNPLHSSSGASAMSAAPPSKLNSVLKSVSHSGFSSDRHAQALSDASKTNKAPSQSAAAVSTSPPKRAAFNWEDDDDDNDSYGGRYANL